MNCQNHPEIAATAYCRTCGKPVATNAAATPSEPYIARSTCPAPAPRSGRGQPPAAAPARIPARRRAPRIAYPDVSPGLAFFLGWIPGVGAIYNGQYAKGLVHAVIWGILCSITNSRAVHGMEPIFGMLMSAWWSYMAFEAYHTARKRRAGEPVDEYSSILDLRGRRDQVPAGGRGADVLGVVLLLHTLDLFDFEEVVALLAGAADRRRALYLLYERFFGRRRARRRRAMNDGDARPGPRHPRTDHPDHAGRAVRAEQLHAVRLRPDLAGAADRVRAAEPVGRGSGAAPRGRPAAMPIRRPPAAARRPSASRRTAVPRVALSDASKPPEDAP